MELSQVPPFYLLNGKLGWKPGNPEDSALSLGVESGIRLDADPSGPLALNNQGESLGGAVLPRRVAVDSEGLVYLLQQVEPYQVLRYNPEKRTFDPLPTIGGSGSDPRQFNQPQAIYAAGRVLFVADTGNQRVQVFVLDGLALRSVWSNHDWKPVDVAADSRSLYAYVLDAKGRRVFRSRAPFDHAELLCSLPEGGEYTRIAVDLEGRIYVLDVHDPKAPCLLSFSPQGEPSGSYSQSGDVRDRFNPPPLRLLYDARYPNSQPYFCLPESLGRLCGRSAPDQEPDVSVPLGLCPPFTPPPSGTIYRLDGTLAELDLSEVLEPLLYKTRGVFLTQALDSARYRCQWHRVVLDVTRLPPGTRLEVSTYSSDTQTAGPVVDSLQWEVGLRVAGEMQQSVSALDVLPSTNQPAPAGDSPTGKTPEDQDALDRLAGPVDQLTSPEVQKLDFLVQSRQGQYLWLKVEMEGDGFDSPAVTALRVYFPRESYLSYLPAVYSMDEEARWFMERFLSIFQTEWDGLEKQISQVAGLFDPSAVPAARGFLDLLAQRLGLALEGTWSAEQKRSLLKSVPKVYPQRGTAAGLRAFLQAYLQSMTGIAPAQQQDFPRLLEAFRMRRRMLLPGPQAGEAPEDQARGLWGPEEVGRMQLGVYAKAGEARLVDTGDPERDLFHQFAHRFKVYIPASWVRTLEDERMIRRALEAEKPVHTAYDLCLVEARFTVGVQSTLGLDSILGELPQARLTSPEVEAESAPSRAPHSRLGYDTILGGEAREPAGRNAPADRGSPRHLPFQVDALIR